MKSMLSDAPHKRFNILTGEWILVSPHRTKRPWQGKMEKPDLEIRPSYDPTCYLCPGNTRNGGAVNDDYKGVFIFKNDFGALLEDSITDGWEAGLLKATGERGICKVICFSPNHALTMPEMEEEDLKKVVDRWQEEFITLQAMDFIHNVQIFENKGSIMGCSNPHPHGQIWAQSSIPQEIKKRTEKMEAYFEKKNRSLLGDYLEQELVVGQRILLENDHFVALVPFWAVWPYETMIIARRHFRSIEEMKEEEKRAFASILKALTIRYDNLFQTSFPYSAGIQQRPVDGKEYPGWHFHYSFYPPLLRSATVKKFMVGYEMFANPQRDISAEQAADKLRNLSGVHYKMEV
jgi:UDPglucose--hexose-1-phosphate uridylyltransferase